MKEHHKDSNFYASKNLPKFVFVFFIIFITLYLIISLHISSTSSCNHNDTIHTSLGPTQDEPEPKPDPEFEPEETGLQHIVFGIGAAAKHWPRRKNYVKYWWPGPNTTRGYVFFDRPVDLARSDNLTQYPTLVVSGSTKQFPYTYRRGSRSALRITRIVSEMVRMVRSDNSTNNSNSVRWFVMGDDDTVFFTENLVRVLRKYDHADMYYIGSNSETHLQNINFAHDMAFGGGGFAISYPLAVAIEKMQDRCIKRYGSLYGSDDRIHACLAELGVPLTKELGFHQCDVYGNLFGLLSAHPIAPIVTLHHLDIVDPLFPYMDRTQALTHLTEPIKLDSSALMQQSICYDTVHNWTVSVSWGYAVQIIRGFITPREMQRPARTFRNWYYRDEPSGFSFSTRRFIKHSCQKPYVYHLNNAEPVVSSNVTDVSKSVYVQHRIYHPYCWWMNDNPEKISTVEVFKKPNPYKWNGAPRRDCCRVRRTDRQNTMTIDVGECGEDEVIEPRF